MISFQLLGSRIKFSPLRLAQGTSLYWKTGLEIFPSYMVLLTSFRLLTLPLEVTSGPWISTWNPVGLIGYVDYNICSNAMDTLHRNKRDWAPFHKTTHNEKVGHLGGKILHFLLFPSYSFCMEVRMQPNATGVCWNEGIPFTHAYSKIKEKALNYFQKRGQLCRFYTACY